MKIGSPHSKLTPSVLQLWIESEMNVVISYRRISSNYLGRNMTYVICYILYSNYFCCNDNNNININDITMIIAEL